MVTEVLKGRTDADNIGDVVSTYRTVTAKGLRLIPCDGSVIQDADYPKLKEVVGDNFVSKGSGKGLDPTYEPLPGYMLLPNSRTDDLFCQGDSGTPFVRRIFKSTDFAKTWKTLYDYTLPPGANAGEANPWFNIKFIVGTKTGLLVCAYNTSNTGFMVAFTRDSVTWHSKHITLNAYGRGYFLPTNSLELSEDETKLFMSSTSSWHNNDLGTYVVTLNIHETSMTTERHDNQVSRAVVLESSNRAVSIPGTDYIALYDHPFQFHVSDHFLATVWNTAAEGYPTADAHIYRSSKRHIWSQGGISGGDISVVFYRVVPTASPKHVLVPHRTFDVRPTLIALGEITWQVNNAVKDAWLGEDGVMWVSILLSTQATQPRSAWVLRIDTNDRVIATKLEDDTYRYWKFMPLEGSVARMYSPLASGSVINLVGDYTIPGMSLPDLNKNIVDKPWKIVVDA